MTHNYLARRICKSEKWIKNINRTLGNLTFCIKYPGSESKFKDHRTQKDRQMISSITKKSEKNGA